MDYREHIQAALEYIEANLTDDIDIALLAKAAGYSEYHFLRIFKDAVNLTPWDYIRKRRLSEIACRMMESHKPASDIAFEYGFNSKENFTRAFKKEHGILPTEFRLSQNSLKLYPALKLAAPVMSLQPEITMLHPFRLITYPCDERLPTTFWNKYNAGKLSLRLSGGRIVEDFGVSIWNREKNKLDYYIGIPETEACGDLAGTVPIPIAGGRYAMFETPPSTHADFVNTIHRTWDYIGRVWLPGNGYKRTGGPEFEKYTEISRCFSEQIFIPIAEISL